MGQDNAIKKNLPNNFNWFLLHQVIADNTHKRYHLIISETATKGKDMFNNALNTQHGYRASDII